jgi:transcriptional regulator with XRE-family HTH domain
MLANIFGENVRRCREALGLTQEKLAELIGVEVRTLSRIECGDQGSTFATIEKIAACLKAEPHTLFDKNLSLLERDLETQQLYDTEIIRRAATASTVREAPKSPTFTRQAKTRFDRNRNQTKDDHASIRIEALSEAFKKLLLKYPATDPGILWGRLQGAHINRLVNDGKNGHSAAQSWVKSSGTAFELFVQNISAPPFKILKPKDFKKLSEKQAVKNSSKLIGRSEDDMMVVYESQGSLFLTGVIQAKTSIRDRFKMDMTHSKHMLEANLWSAFITIDPDGFLNKPKFNQLANGTSGEGVIWHGVYALSHTVQMGDRLHDAGRFTIHLIEASEAVVSGKMRSTWAPATI